MKKILVFILGLVICCNIYSNEIIGNYGVGVGDAGIEAPIQSVVFSFRNRMNDYFINESSVVFLKDSKNFKQYHTFGGFVGIGSATRVGQFELSATWAVGGITTPDPIFLGGQFPQFLHHFMVRFFDDKYPTSVGFSYFHISSAGLAGANKGRDLIAFSLGWAL